METLFNIGVLRHAKTRVIGYAVRAIGYDALSDTRRDHLGMDDSSDKRNNKKQGLHIRGIRYLRPLDVVALFIRGILVILFM